MHLSVVLLGLISASSFVNGVTSLSMKANNGQTARCDKTPVNNCNCQCTVKQDSCVKSLEAKVESLIELKNKTFGLSNAIKSLESKLVSLIGLNNITSSGRVAMKSLEAKVESLIGLINKTSSASDSVKSLEAKMESLIGIVNSTFSTIPTAVPKPTVTSAAAAVSSCKEQYHKESLSKSQVYNLSVGAQRIPVYCHMGDFGCGGGGWTLALKTDGVKRTFRFNSPLWNNKNAYNVAGGKTGFDTQETKLPTYWKTNFTKICLGMRIGSQTRFVALNQTADSLYSLIADGAFRAADLGRDSWKMLVGPQGSLQRNCNREGFNAVCTKNSNPSKARIGILGNNQNDCVSCDSRIGFGMEGDPDGSIRCGVAARNYADNGEKYINAFGYILVQ